MNIGIATTDFTTRGADALFGTIAAMGFASAQFAFASITESDFIPDGRIEIPPVIPPSLIAVIQKAAARHGITIPACNGTFNMSHPDAEVRHEGLRRFEGFAAAVRALGAGIVSLCSGTRNREHLWRFHPESQTAGAWEDMLDSMRRAVEIAERNGLTLAVETEYSNVVDTAAKARRMMDAVGSPRLKMVMDCANLFHPGQAHRDKVSGVLEDAFALIGKDAVIAHGKDIAASDGISFCPTGEGIVDFPLFALLLKQYGFAGDMILHGIYDEGKMPAGLAIVQKAMRYT
jgi:sugar phosphate isomerase/epimerase